MIVFIEIVPFVTMGSMTRTAREIAADVILHYQEQGRIKPVMGRSDVEELANFIGRDIPCNEGAHPFLVVVREGVILPICREVLSIG